MEEREDLYAFCLRTGSHALLDQWHPAWNLPLTPHDVTRGTHREVWWRCPRGHVWQAAVKSRAAGAGCPVCTGRRIVPGVNDLATLRPEAAALWHPTRNGALRPQDVAPGSRRRVWWRCPLGHEWQASIAACALGGSRCPVCANRRIEPGVNDLASVRPDLAAQWDGERNAPLTPDRLAANSNRRVWWRCPLGHEFRSTVAQRVRQNTGCPYCTGRLVLPGFNDLATRDPAVAAQWHPTLNGALGPQDVTLGSSRKVWWLCPDGHVWKAVISSRTGPQHCGCPVCAGKRRPPRRTGEPL